MTRIIVACDDMPACKIFEFVQKNKNESFIVKVNSALADSGASLVGSIQHPNHNNSDRTRRQVMADPKYSDIPNTIANYCYNFARRDNFNKGYCTPEILTVHASGGVSMMKKAVECLPWAKVFAITVLTSIDHQECIRIYRRSPKKQVKVFAEMALESGVAGIVCSPQELKMLRSNSKFDDLELMTPGIRPKWFCTKNDDQKRVMTPAQAILHGADYIVVGRPITTADDPLVALQKIREEIEQVLIQKQRRTEQHKKGHT